MFFGSPVISTQFLSFFLLLHTIQVRNRRRCQKKKRTLSRNCYVS